jgi:uncharacterized protein YktA (UPF0223 family)
MKLTLLPFGSDVMKDAIEIETPEWYDKIIKEREFERAKKTFKNSVSSEMERTQIKNNTQEVIK